MNFKHSYIYKNRMRQALLPFINLFLIFFTANQHFLRSIDTYLRNDAYDLNRGDSFELY